MPDHVARIQRTNQELLHLPEGGVQEILVKELWRLEDDFGLATPRVSSRHSAEQDFFTGEPKAWIISDKIEGHALVPSKWGVLPVPESVAVQAIDAIIKYYEAAAVDSSTETYYFSDLGIHQCMYGKQQGDSEDKLYMVDVDPFLLHPSDISFAIIRQRLLVGLGEIESSYSSKLDDLRERISYIGLQADGS